MARGRTCEYPPKFRSIAVDNLLTEPISMPPSLETSREGSVVPERPKRARTASTEQVHLHSDDIGRENEALKLKIRELKLSLKRQRSKMDEMRLKLPDDSDTESMCESAEPTSNNATSGIPGASLEESEEEHKNYYGPNSTTYMAFADKAKLRSRRSGGKVLPTLVASNTSGNKSAVTSLLRKFMHLKVHYVNYMQVDSLVEFVEADDDTGNDERSLLIFMIVIVVLRSLPQKDSMLQQLGISYSSHRDRLYRQYRHLKTGIHRQSTTVLRAYVLECEDLFFNDRIEQSWDVLFLAVSMAYSLGLHVYDASIANTLKNEAGDKASDIIRSNERTSLWLVVNFVSATLCSVLGRPNPVTFTYQPLLKNYEIRLNYKMALAELVNRSTNITIDSYTAEIAPHVVREIDSAFSNEAKIYEKILVDTRIVKNLPSRDVTRASFITLPVVDSMDHIRKKSKTANDCDLDIRFTILRPCKFRSDEEHFCMILEDGDTLCDLILLYGNRAKFNQHFMIQYKHSLESCIDSCKCVLDHSLDLIELLYRKIGEPRFQAIYPFFYVFLYQTFVVIYTMLHMNFNLLLPYANDVEIIRNKLFKLFDAVGAKNWRPNVIKMIEAINELCDKFFEKLISLVNNTSAQSEDSIHANDSNSSGKVFGLTPIKEANEPLLKHNKTFTNSNNIKMYSIPENIQKQLDQAPKTPEGANSSSLNTSNNNHSNTISTIINNTNVANSNKSTPRLMSMPSFSKMSMTFLTDMHNNANGNHPNHHLNNTHGGGGTPTINDIVSIGESPSFLKLLEMNKRTLDDPSLELSPGMMVPYNNVLNLDDPFFIQNPSNFQYNEKSPSNNDTVSSTHTTEDLNAL